jgi:uncharacterized protein (TIGR00730 family)
MPAFKSLCVFCGSSSGRDPAYLEAARSFGAMLGRENIRLVYGGGHVGMMGALSDAVMNAGGHVLGIIPEFLVAREHAREGKNELMVVRDMHERKAMMVQEADAFVALPGGVGTLEELVEQLTWLQLDRHKKPILLANIKGYWNPLIALFQHMQSEKFLYDGVRYLVADRAEDIVPTLRAAVEAQGEDAKAVAGGM